MTPKTLSNLRNLVGHVCSIVTTSMNRSFDERVAREHFVVVIEDISADGIWGIHPHEPDLISFFNMNYVISIHKEQVLDPNNPDHAKLIQEYEKKTGKKVESDLYKAEEKSEPLLPVIEKKPAPQVSKNQGAGDAMFVDIENLESLAESTKRTFDAYDILGKKKPL